jgi:uncharacterized protein YuzE
MPCHDREVRVASPFAMFTRTTYDKQHDVLYVKDVLSRISYSQEHSIDGDLVLNYSREGRITGIQFLFVSDVKGMWCCHPGRHCLPGPIRDEVDRFMSWLDAGPKDPEQCAARRVPPQWCLDAAA